MLKLIQTPLSNIQQQQPDEKNQQTSFCSTSLCCRMPPLVHILFDPVSHCFFIYLQKGSYHKWRDQQTEDGWTVWAQQILWSNAGEMDLHPPDSELEHWPAWRRPIALWMTKDLIFSTWQPVSIFVHKHFWGRWWELMFWLLLYSVHQGSELKKEDRTREEGQIGRAGQEGTVGEWGRTNTERTAEQNLILTLTLTP